MTTKSMVRMVSMGDTGHKPRRAGICEMATSRRWSRATVMRVHRSVEKVTARTLARMDEGASREREAEGLVAEGIT